MNRIYDLVGGRKFALAMTVTIGAFVMVWFGKMTGDQVAWLIAGVAVPFITAEGVKDWQAVRTNGHKES